MGQGCDCHCCQQKSGTYVYDGSLVMEDLTNEPWSMDIDSRLICRSKETFYITEPPDGFTDNNKKYY